MDYSLHRLQHYTSTAPTHFQNFVLFTNYQFYVDEFCARARALMASGNQDYEMLVEPGNRITRRGESGPAEAGELPRLPQMPAYHLVRGDHSGITLVNIGVGPSNAKTITDHIAVLRPHAWLMLGHCAGLRDSQRLGDYVLAHGYVREDHVLDADLPTWVPVPALAEVQVALEQAVEEVAGLSGWDLKRIMRTGTVATIDNRNWELRDHVELVERFAQSRAIALDMESATIAANGFRFRVPYGTLLCVSDKPLHGELKLPGMASAFYRRQVNQHLEIGIRALERLRGMPPERCTPASCGPSWKPPSNSRHGGPASPPCPSLIHPQYRDRGFLLQICYRGRAAATGLPITSAPPSPLGTAFQRGQRSRLCRSAVAPRGARKRSGWAHFAMLARCSDTRGAGGLSRGISQAPSRSHKERTLAPSEHDESRAAGKAVTGGESPSGLRRALSARHLTMIAVGGSIGTGLFVASGATVAQAGPGRAAGLRADRHHGLFPDDQPGRAGRGHAGFRLFSTYGARYVEEGFGFALGWNYWYNWAVTVAVDLVAAQLVMAYWFP